MTPVASDTSISLATAILDTLPSRIVILDKEGIIRQTNQAWLDFAINHGMPSDYNWIGVNYLDICHTPCNEGNQDACKAAAGIKAVLNEEQDSFQQIYDCHSNDKKQWFSMRVSRLNWSDDAALIVQHDDVSSFKVVENELASSLQRSKKTVTGLADSYHFLQTIANNLPAMVGYWDKHLRCRFANQAYEAYFGREPDTLIDSHLRTLLGENLYIQNQAYIEGVLSGADQQFERVITKTDGSLSYNLCHYLADTDSAGNTVGFFVLVIDVSALKHAEAQRYEALVELEEKHLQLELAFDIQKAAEAERRISTPLNNSILDQAYQFMAVLTLDGKIVTINNNTLRFGGLEREAVLNQTVWETRWFSVSAPLRQDLQHAVQRAAAGETTQFEGHDILAGDDSRHTVQISVKPIFDDNGTIIYLLSEGHDITELQQLNAQLASQNQMLQASLSQRDSLQAQLLRAQRMEVFGQLTAGVSHEFNNILAVIMGYNDMVMEDLQASGMLPQLSFLQNVDTASRRGRDLVKSMMDYARVVDKPGNSQSFNNPLPAVEATVKMLRATLSAVYHLHGDLHAVPPVALTGSDMQQIVSNLIINARDAMPHGGLINVVLKPLTSTSSHWCNACGQALSMPLLKNGVELSVADTGSGISADIMHQIFDPFFTTKPVDKGSGLGLSVISGLVHHASGHIVVESDPIDGTTIRILLPTQSAADINTGPGLFALVVDDEIGVQQLLSMRLERMGYTVDSFNNPILALEAVTQDPARYAVILTDYSMPNMDGIDLSFAIRALNPNVPIVMCSGLEIPESDLPIGCTTVFKPINFDALVALIKTLA